MNHSRLELQTIFEKIMHSIWAEIPDDRRGSVDDYSHHVYFQPGSNVTMQYPAIVYERDSSDSTFADNRPYYYQHRYTITVIDKDPDSAIPDKVAHLPMTIMDRHFVSDNMHHDVFLMYF